MMLTFCVLSAVMMGSTASQMVPCTQADLPRYCQEMRDGTWYPGTASGLPPGFLASSAKVEVVVVGKPAPMPILVCGINWKDD